MDRRPVIHEGHDGVKAACHHDICGWVVLRLEKGPGQIRWACRSCGWRDRGSVPQPYDQHPDRDSYPLLVPRREWRHGRPQYDDYLESDEWQERRQAALNHADGRCRVCNSDRRLQVHHRTYERLGRELESDLTVLCSDCHQLFHEHRQLVDWREAA